MDNKLKLQRKFLDELRLVHRGYGLNDIFTDACRAFAISLHQPTILGTEECRQYEAEYMSIAKKYGKDGMNHIAQCLEILVEALELRREDFLGHILEELNATNKHFGQFFTPLSVSRMMGSITMGNEKPVPGKIVKFNDPACGAGALLIEGAEAFIRSGGRQCDLVIYGEDLDSNAFNIAFTQFTLLGYAARVTRMDSIAMKVFEGPWYTIGYFAHGIPMRVGRETPAECNADAEPMTATEGTAKTEELAPPPAAPSVPIAEQTPDAKGGFIQGDLFG